MFQILNYNQTYAIYSKNKISIYINQMNKKQFSNTIKIIINSF